MGLVGILCSQLIQMLLDKVYFNEAIRISGWIKQPILQDDVAYPFRPDFREVVDQMEHLNEHDPPGISSFHSISKFSRDQGITHEENGILEHHIALVSAP